MRLLLDARKLNDGGIGVYIENLLEGFIESGIVDNEIAITLFIRSDDRAKHPAIARWGGRFYME